MLVIQLGDGVLLVLRDTRISFGFLVADGVQNSVLSQALIVTFCLAGIVF